MKKKNSLYGNIQKCKKKGTCRSKGDSTIDPKTYKAMKSKTGKFKPKGKK